MSTSKKKETQTALNANIEQMKEFIGEIVIHDRYAVLLEVVASLKGLSKNLEVILLEICHPFHNWNLIIPALRGYILKHMAHYHRHERGPEAFAVFTSIFLDALSESRKNGKLVAAIVEAMLAYVDKMVAFFKAKDLALYGETLNQFFTSLRRLDAMDEEVMMYIVQGYHPMKEVAMKIKRFSEAGDGTDFDFGPIALLMRKILELNYGYWLKEEDPQTWFANNCGKYCEGWESARAFYAISHERIREHQATLASIDVEANPVAGLAAVLDLPAHRDVVRLYRAIPATLGAENASANQGGSGSRFAENQKLLFLFRIMDTDGLYLIHEETLREINRSLVLLIREQNFEDIEQFFITTFKLLKLNVRKYPHTALQCIQVIGGEVFKRGNSRLVETFLWEAVRFGFQYANVLGVDEDWQPITNPAHLANIRVWLNLIMQEPKWCSTLFSALIINLKLSGTCVKDTDLFQRDVTELLNHPIEPIYNLAKQFTKLMPVFFNEIGAEGELRDVSTELDETHKRRDKLIHFLRKQSHVESSNLIVGFIKAIFHFWLTREKEVLRDFLPVEVYNEVETSGLFVDEQHRLAAMIHQDLEFRRIEDLLQWDDADRKRYLAGKTEISAMERRRFTLLVKMYTLLHQKYNLGLQELRHQLQQAINTGFPEMESLLADLEICDTRQCLASLLNHLEQLKAVILSEERFQPKEDIFYKRHIAVDIPSVYGRYSERKFDALGLSFRLENLANVYLEKLAETINLGFITQATFIRIVECLNYYLQALRIDGITSRRLETYVSLLESSIHIKRFSYTQYLDIFHGLSEGVKDVIYAYYTNVHENNLQNIIPQIGEENLLTVYRPLWDSKDRNSTIHRLSEAFFRDLIATTFGLQHLDNFISRIILTLEAQRDVLEQDTLDLLMTYNPERAISALYNENLHTHSIIHLGNKGFNLMLLANEGFRVPPALIITTEIFRCWSAVEKFNRASEEFMQRLRNAVTGIEQRAGARFGDPEMPLLLSVRSGSAISMPGMMTTIHNVGLNVDIIEEYVEQGGGEYFIWDNFRRFIQSWAMSQGMEREEFQEVMNQHKARAGITLKREFTPAQMRELALDYQHTVRARGFGVPDDPWQQLIGAVKMVLASWNTTKAREYRNLMSVSDDWGTAVIVQAMVYGNKGAEAGSGVLFTAHPYRKVRRVALWGDYATADQGEDIVSGLVTSHSVSVEQAELDGRKPECTLERQFPAIYEELLRISRILVYEKRWNPQEIEFTFEGPEAEDLYLLQTRDMITIKKKERFEVFIDSEGLRDQIIGRGIGVSGSALSGRAVFTVADIRGLRREDPLAKLILIRQDTVPDDIKEISLADGLLTARGGQTSHASVVATRLEKTCVVGCKSLQVVETERYCQIEGLRIQSGDPISIDGRNGLVIRGTHPVKEEIHILPL